MANQRIRIKLKGYEYGLVDASAEKIVETARRTGAQVSGPIPLPTEKEVVTILRAVHKYKDSREQFETRTHKRLIDILQPSAKTVDALMMTQLFRADGTMIPVTVVEAGPCPVVQKKTVAKEGYDAVQVGFCELREKLANKPLKGHCAKAGVKAMRYLRELKLDESAWT